MELNTRSPQKPHILLIGAIGLLLAVIVLYFSNTWTVRSARQNTDEAVHTVSDFYLRELAGRRGQVIASYLDGNIQNIYTAVAQLEEQDLSDLFHLMMFQARIERLYELERFAFVDTKGQIYTSFGIRKNIKEYRFHDRLLTAPDISVKDMESEDTTVVIAVPVSGISFEGETFVSCFIEIDIRRMLDSFSLQNDESSTTYCNLYYKNGLSLTDEVLSGRSDSRNLVEALREA